MKAIWSRNNLGCNQIKEDVSDLLNGDIDSFSSNLEKYLKELKQIIIPNKYDDFKEGESLTIEIMGETVKGNFLKWKHKSDRPNGFFLYITQKQEEYRAPSIRSLNDQLITSINGKPFTLLDQ